jgi:sulfate adenylyltransferase subunit 1
MSALEKIDLLEHGVLRFITAGSVDDGKSTLIGRLLYDTKTILADQLAAIARTSQRRGGPLDLSLLTDGLSSEREQGITIDVAYRYFATALVIHIADTPGHEQYTQHVTAPALPTGDPGRDARHGVVTQHGGMRRSPSGGDSPPGGAVNKMDLVDFDRASSPRSSPITAFARRRAAMRVSTMSALDGDSLVDRGSRLPGTADRPLQISKMESAPTLAQGPLRFSAIRARPAAGQPRGYMGRIESGAIAVGDVVTVLPSLQSARVRAIRTYEGDRRHAGLHAAVTIVLDKELDISRGDMLVHPDSAPAISRTVDASLCWLASAPLDSRRRYLLRHTTREARAKVERIDYLWNVSTQSREPAPAALAMNEIGHVRLALTQPAFVDATRRAATGSFI